MKTINKTTYLIEIQDADKLIFIEDKQYLVLRNFDHSNIIGTCHVFRKDAKIYADISCHQHLEGYPAIAYIKITNNRYEFKALGICDNPNLDPEIKKIKIIKHHENKTTINHRSTNGL